MWLFSPAVIYAGLHYFPNLQLIYNWNYFSLLVKSVSDPLDFQSDVKHDFTTKYDASRKFSGFFLATAEGWIEGPFGPNGDFGGRTNGRTDGPTDNWFQKFRFVKALVVTLVCFVFIKIISTLLIDYLGIGHCHTHANIWPHCSQGFIQNIIFSVVFWSQFYCVKWTYHNQTHKVQN